MSDLMSKLKKNSRVKDTEILTDSKIFTNKDMITTDVPMLNVALGGELNGGLTPGLTVFAGPSKHYKTNMSLKIVSSYMKKYPESILLFYDSEFGSPEKYFESFEIDTSRVLHTPIKHVEELKFDLSNQLEEISRGDKVIILIDSIGNLASKKELEDALNEKSVADMSRAKALKSLFRMTTPYLALKDIPLIAINHTYQEMGLYPKAVVSGGCVVEGTKIQTPQGVVEIQNIRPGDVILTQYGDKEVKEVWNPDTLDEGTPECYEIEFEDGYKVTCSENHKFIVDGEWVMAKDLVIGMDCESLNT